MVAERLVQRFWPASTILMAAIAALAFRVADLVSPPVLMTGAAGATLGFLVALVMGARGFSWPSAAEAEARLDATMPGRPLATLQDDPAIGQDDPASLAVWQAHLSRMAALLKGARAPSPDLRVAARDPFALRLVAATALVAAILFGAVWRLADVSPVCWSF